MKNVNLEAAIIDLQLPTYFSHKQAEFWLKVNKFEKPICWFSLQPKNEQIIIWFLP